MIAAVWGRFAPYLIAAGVVVVAVVVFIAKVFGAGKTAAKAAAAMDALARTRDANEARAKASQPSTPEDESRDPFNRDRS